MATLLENPIQEHTQANKKIKKSEKTPCYHCGDDCPSNPIEFDEHDFCCTGCQTVYDILTKNGLDNYYNLEKTGIAPSSIIENPEQFTYLDNEELMRQLVDFTDGNFTRITFKLPQIHCASCVWLLEKLPNLFEGVQDSKVNYLRREASVSFYSKTISLRILVENLTKLGYSPDLKLESKNKKKTDNLPPNFLLRLGVAGFCFGNLMLLSFPEYLGLPIVEDDFPRFFGYLNILLSLPVLLFSGANYFKDAFYAIKHKTLNFDIPIALGITALFGRSIFEIISQTGAGYLDSLAALIFLLLVGQWFQRRTFDSISFERDYQSYFPLAALLEVNNDLENDTNNKTTKSISLSDLKINDIVIVKNGQLIPADGELLEGKAQIDYSFVSGESEPIKCKKGQRLYAGGRQWGEPLRIKLLKTVSQSYLMQLWNSDTFDKDNSKLLKNLTQRWGRNFTIFVLLVAFGSASYWLYAEGWQIAINVFTSVLIVACPCALALNAPFAFGNARQILAKKLFFLKNTDSIEMLASQKAHLIFDKTGTLTTSTPSAIWKSIQKNEELTIEDKQALAALASYSLHPISKAIYAAISEFGEGIIYDFEEKIGAGTQAKIQNPKNKIGFDTWKIGNANFVGMNNRVFNSSELNSINENQKSVVFVSKNDEVKGYFELLNPLRENSLNLLQEFKNQNFELSLLSGDTEREKMRFVDIFGEKNIHFNQKPIDKLEFLKNLKTTKTDENQSIFMIGDGLNDAGALKQSDFGIAISENQEQFSPACDAILRAESLPKLAKFMCYARQTIWVVRFGLLISLCYNLVGLSFAVSGTLSPIVAAILMPLSSITVVGMGVFLTWFLGRKL
ncbi:heavy metal translocating P-type ATPase metal-binding domain-containing protein [Bernardetia sp. Wsw4-3y2]|uniref:heavy metal translocating P-type ATPase n=1 Tax=Bernardetia sp. Wsw4-3y2 TaxID=3127471 RepID=UPI0030CCA15B